MECLVELGPGGVVVTSSLSHKEALSISGVLRLIPGAAGSVEDEEGTGSVLRKLDLAWTLPLISSFSSSVKWGMKETAYK